MGLVKCDNIEELITSTSDNIKRIYYILFYFHLQKLQKVVKIVVLRKDNTCHWTDGYASMLLLLLLSL